MVVVSKDTVIPKGIVIEYTDRGEIMSKDIPLSEDLKYWRAERPDEWTMSRFIRKATELEGLVTGYLTELCNLYEEIDRLKECKEDETNPQ